MNRHSRYNIIHGMQYDLHKAMILPHNRHVNYLHAYIKSSVLFFTDSSAVGDSTGSFGLLGIVPMLLMSNW